MAALHDGTGIWEGRGYTDMCRKAGIPEGPAEATWQGLERFASYSYNKSHAVSYAILGFRCLFAKYYGPAEFFTACIRSLRQIEDDEESQSAKDDKKKRAEMMPLYINEARRLGIPVHAPNIGMSNAIADVDDDGEIWMGFSDVKGVGLESAEWLQAYRDHSGRLATVDELKENMDALSVTFAQAKKDAVKEGTWVAGKKSPKQSLGAGKITNLYDVGAWGRPDLSMTELQAKELEYLQVVLTDNSDEILDCNAMEIAGCDDWEDLLTPWDEKYELGEERTHFAYEVPGIISDVKTRVARKSGDTFGIVTIEYGRNSVEFTVFAKRWKSHRFLFKLRTTGIFTLHHTPATEKYPEGYKFSSGRKLTT